MSGVTCWSRLPASIGFVQFPTVRIEGLRSLSPMPPDRLMMSGDGYRGIAVLCSWAMMSCDRSGCGCSLLPTLIERGMIGKEPVGMKVEGRGDP